MANRDDFPEKIKTILAKRVSYRCSNPNCRKITVGANSDPEKFTNMGVAAHITAAAAGGPRYDGNLTSAERKSISNGIWLCNQCSVLIDKDIGLYPVDKLRNWKNIAEKQSQNEVNDMGISQEDPDDFDLWEMDFEKAYDNFEKCSTVLCNIQSLLARARNTVSWDNRSELKLFSWLNDHSEKELDELSYEELLDVQGNVIEYLKLHLEMESEQQQGDYEEYDNVNWIRLYIRQYISIHPAYNLQEIAEANLISINSMRAIIKQLSEQRDIVPLEKCDKNGNDISFEKLLWITLKY